MFWNRMTKKVKKMKPEEKQLWGIPPMEQYAHAIEFIRIAKDEWQGQEDEMILYYVKQIVQEDLKCDLLTKVIYLEEGCTDTIRSPFPLTYYDEEGISYRLDYGEKVEVDLANQCVIMLPWEKTRMARTIVNIGKNPFRYMPTNHMAFYYKGPDICYAYNGNHSIGAGVAYKKGMIMAKVLDITPLYPHVYTNGEQWLSVHDDGSLGNLCDFRIGVLYEIAKMEAALRTK